MLEWVCLFIGMTLIGLIIIFTGWRIWKREQITLIHDYHYTKVAEKDKKPYTEKMGKACIIMGTGPILTGITGLLIKSLYCLVVFAIFFLWGILKIISAQKKYNGGIF